MKEKLLYPINAWQKLLYLAISGFALGACMSFQTAIGAIIEWVAFIPAALVLFELADKPRRSYWYGFFFTYCIYFVVWHWIVSFYPMDFAGMSRLASAAVVALGWCGLPLIAAFAGGFVFLIFARVAKNVRPAFYPFLAAALWAIFEWSQTLTWAGVPWGRLALGQIVGSFTATAMTASLFGSYFISALIIAVASLLAQAMRLGLFKWRSIVAASLALGNLICGAILCALPQGEDSVTVAAVQGNISSRSGYYSHTNKEIWDIYEDYTRRAAAEGAKIVLWPESVFTSRFLSTDKRLQADLAALASECGITVVMGCFDYNDNGDILNALVAYHSSGNADSELYCKRHLVPFGEYMPWRSFFEVVFPPLTEIAMLSEDIIAGESAAVMKDGGVALGGVICFDSIYEEVALDSVRNGAELLVLPTNDSWFGDSRAIYMHNAQARLRAIENARSIVRAANTGTSSIITPNGKMLADIPVNEGGYIVADVPISTGLTLYTRIGNAFVLACAVFVSSLGAVGLKKKTKC